MNSFCRWLRWCRYVRGGADESKRRPQQLAAGLALVPLKEARRLPAVRCTYPILARGLAPECSRIGGRIGEWFGVPTAPRHIRGDQISFGD